MAKYTECEALIEHIKDLPTWDYIAKADGVYEKSTKYPEGNFNCDDVINSIANAPATDVVKVTRCKECAHWGGVTYGFVCRKFSGIETKICMHADDYCSYGERSAENV